MFQKAATDEEDDDDEEKEEKPKKAPRKKAEPKAKAAPKKRAPKKKVCCLFVPSLTCANCLSRLLKMSLQVRISVTKLTTSRMTMAMRALETNAR